MPRHWFLSHHCLSTKYNSLDQLLYSKFISAMIDSLTVVIHALVVNSQAGICGATFEDRLEAPNSSKCNFQTANRYQELEEFITPVLKQLYCLPCSLLSSVQCADT